MTDSPCPICGRPLPESAFICSECVRSAAAQLDDIADFLAWADDKRARRGSTWRFGTVGRTAEAPLPYDPRVTKTVSPLRTWLIGWGRILEEEAGLEWPADDAELARWLGEHTGWIASHEAAADFAGSLRRHHAAMVRLFDNPPQREAIGQCGGDLEGGTCPEVLAAEAGAAYCDCPRCGTRHDVRERRSDLLEQAADLQVTIAEAVRLMRVDGRDVTPRLLWAIVRTVGIASVGQRLELDSKGRRRQVDVYRLGALQGGLEATEADPAHRRAVKRAMRGQRELGRATLDA